MEELSHNEWQRKAIIVLTASTSDFDNCWIKAVSSARLDSCCWSCSSESERERETDRQTHRQTHRWRQRQTETDRKREREIKTYIVRCTHTGTHQSFPSCVTCQYVHWPACGPMQSHPMRHKTEKQRRIHPSGSSPCTSSYKTERVYFMPRRHTHTYTHTMTASSYRPKGLTTDTKVLLM